MSSSEISINRKFNFIFHAKIEFGQYVHTHEEHDHTMQSRTIGDIATDTTGNAQGV